MNYRDTVHKLISTSLIHRYHITKSAQKAGLYYGQPMLLEYIKEHSLCTQKELADSLHISPASVATSIKRLEKSGFVKRSTDKEDVRKNRLSLTDIGLDILTEFRSICDETDKEMFKGFSEEECDLLCNYLQRLYNNLDTENLTNCQMKAEIEKDEKKAKEEANND